MGKTKALNVTFAGINFPGANIGINYAVNQSYFCNWENKAKHFFFQGQPDADGWYPWVQITEVGRDDPNRPSGGDPRIDTYNVWYRLEKSGGQTRSDVFRGVGVSPVANTLVIVQEYGGTATITT